MKRKAGKLLIYVTIRILIVALVVGLIPPKQAEANTNNPEKSPVEGFEELTSLRTANSKTYLDSGTMEYVLEEYLEPIHFMVNGEWEDIDNNIEEEKSEKDNADLAFGNKGNKYKVKFSKKSKESSTVRVKYKGSQLEFGLVGSKQVKGIIEGNSITYEGVFKDTDLRFHVDNNAVKEEIVLHAPTDKTTYSYEVKTKKLQAVEGENGDVLFIGEDGETVFTFTKPFMYDSNDEFSYDVSMSLREQGNKTFIDLEVNESWLNSTDRQYPIIIDPTVDIQDSRTEDAFVSSNFPNSNYYSDPTLITGKQIHYGTTRSYVRFHLKNLLSGANITSARITLTSHSNLNGFDHSTGVSIYPVNQSWDSRTVSWNNQPATGAAISNTTIKNDGDYSFFITNLVKEWYSGKRSNFGIMLRNTDENVDRKMFRSSDYTFDQTKRPKITVVYTIDPIGIESFWTSAFTNVNTYNGNFFLPESDVAIEGRGLPLSVDRMYNSRSQNLGVFGQKWASNLDQRLTFADGGIVVYHDPDGTEHYFSKNADGGYDSPGGVALELSRKGDGTFQLERADQTKILFNTTGLLTGEVDSNQNVTSYAYSSGKLSAVTDASGRRLTISYGSNGLISTIVDPANRQYQYQYDVNKNLTSYRMLDKNGKVISTVSYGYDSTGKMTSNTDVRGVKLTFAYDSGNRLIKFEEPVTINGSKQTNYFTMSYDQAKGITTATDARGVKTEYHHNAYGNVIKLILDAGGLSYTRTYRYDDNNNLIEEKDENAHFNQTSNVYTYEYNNNGELTEYTNPLNETSSFEYDENNNLVEATDAMNNVTSEDYDEQNNNVASVDAAKKTSAAKYDAYGNIIEQTSSISVGENILANGSFELDANNDNWPDQWKKIGTATFTYVNGGAEIQQGKLGDKQIKMTNPSTNASVESEAIAYNPEKKYVASGYVKAQNATFPGKVTITGKTSTGAITKEISSPALTGTTNVERLHVIAEPGAFPANTSTIHVKAYANPGSGEIFFDGIQLEEEYYGAYNLLGNSSFEKDTNNNRIPDQWYFSGTFTNNDGIDADTRLAGAKSVKVTGQRGVDKFIRQEVFVNGKAGQELTVSGYSKAENVSPTGGPYQINVAIHHKDGTTQWVNGNFDNSGSRDWQHISLRFAATKDFTKLTFYYQLKDQTGTAWFDAAKVQVGSIRTKTAYDSKGNYPVNITDANGYNIFSSYDVIGNVTGHTLNGDTRYFEYDSQDQLTKVTDELGYMTRYEYDNGGNLVSSTDAKGGKITYAYDERNKRTLLTDALGRSIRYEYDIVGNEVKRVFPNNNSISHTYNAVNRITSTSFNDVKRFEFTYDPNGNLLSEKDILLNTTITNRYDADNKLIEKSSSRGQKIQYTYDKNGNIVSGNYSSGASSIKIDRTYDKNDQLTTVKGGDIESSFTYTENNNLAGIKHKNGVYSSYNYDGADQLTKVWTADAAGKVIDSYSYTYDEKGFRTSEASLGGTHQFAYDKRGQLIKEILPDGTVYEYVYDQVGNRTSKKMTKNSNVSTIAYQYDAANQLVSVNGNAVQHDANGNLTSYGNKTYHFDANNRLVEIKEGGTSIVKYEYNNEGIRTSKTIGSSKIYYTHDQNNNVIMETNQQGTIITSYTYDSGHRPLTMTKGGKTYSFHENGHGDITSVTDQSGKVVAKFEYDAWGNVLKQSGEMAADIPFRYAGYWLDSESGLYYLQQRYYSADLGRFLTLDPILGDLDNPITQHGYIYANNNPVMYKDPDGRVAWWITSAAIGAAMNALPMLIGHLARHRSLKGFNWKRFGTAAAVGAITSIGGAGLYRALASIGTSVIGKVATMASYGAKAYLLNTVAKGQKPTLRGLAGAYITGGLVKGLNLVDRAKKAFKKGGIKELRRYISRIR